MSASRYAKHIKEGGGAKRAYVRDVTYCLVGSRDKYREYARWSGLACVRMPERRWVKDSPDDSLCPPLLEQRVRNISVTQVESKVRSEIFPL